VVRRECGWPLMVGAAIVTMLTISSAALGSQLPEGVRVLTDAELGAVRGASQDWYCKENNLPGCPQGVPGQCQALTYWMKVEGENPPIPCWMWEDCKGWIVEARHDACAPKTTKTCNKYQGSSCTTKCGTVIYYPDAVEEGGVWICQGSPKSADARHKAQQTMCTDPEP
jgi:hypothetical protein